MTYQFAQQKEVGDRGELLLDRWLLRFYNHLAKIRKLYRKTFWEQGKKRLLQNCCKF